MTSKLKVYSAVRWTTVTAGARAVLQIAQLSVLARLLSPEEYGLMAMVTVVIGFAGLFADMGMNSAFVQRQNVSEQERSSLFWLNLGMSIVVMLVVIAFSPLLAIWFSDERLTPLLMMAASILVFSAIGQQVRMSAEKVLNFRPVALLEITASVLGFAASVFAAFAGWGVYALIVGGIVIALANSVLAWLFLADGWRPLYRFRTADVRSYMGFGGALVANNLVNELNRNIDLLLAGRMLDATALGLFSIPRQIVFQIQNLINPIITRVGFPLIAQLQNDKPRVRTVYLKTLNMTASINAPLFIFVAFFAPEVVHIVLGGQWIAASGLMSLLAVWGFLRSTGNPVGSLLLGMGRADLSLKWNMAMIVIVPPLLWFGANHGTMGLAWALLAFHAAIFIPIWYVLVRPLCEAGLAEYTTAALLPLLVALVSIAPAYILTTSITNPYSHLAVAASISVPLYFLVSYLVNREWVVAVRHLASLSR